MGLPNGPAERILQVVSMSTPGPGVSEARIFGCITAAQILGMGQSLLVTILPRGRESWKC